MSQDRSQGRIDSPSWHNRMEYYANEIMLASTSEASDLLSPLTDIRDELINSSPSGEGIISLMEMLYQIYTELVNVVGGNLQLIADNTNSSKSDIHLLEDSTGTVFLAVIDKVLNTATYKTLEGASYSPVGSTTIAGPDRELISQSAIFEAKTNSAGNWAAGQQLRRIEIVNASTNAILSVIWINDATGATLTATPVIGTDCDAQPDLILDIVRAGLGTPSDIAADSDTANKGLISLTKRLLTKLPVLGTAAPAESIPTVLSSTQVVTGPTGQTTGNNLLTNDNTPLNVSAFGSGYLVFSSTATGGTWQLEESIDGSNWIPVSTIDMTFGNGSLVWGPVTATNSVRFYKMNLSLPFLRVRVISGLTGGSAQASIALSQRPLASASVMRVGNGAAATNVSTAVVLANHSVVTGPAAQTATANNILASDSATATDVSAFRSGHLDIRSTATAGTWIAEESIDGTVWFPVVLYESTAVNPTPIVAAVTATNSNRAFKFNLTMPLFRVRIATTLTGGSAQARASFSQGIYSHPIVSVVQATAGNLNTTVSGSVGVNSLTAVQQAIPTTTTDVASAAITSTATTAAFTPTQGVTQEFQINVTATSGTGQTYAVSVEESLDSGTNWTEIYRFLPITTTGNYRSGPIAVSGNRIRYVQTIGGTTPSFTRSINRINHNDTAIAAAADVRHINGSIATGGTAQTQTLLKTNRNSLEIYNTHASSDLWVRFDGGVAAVNTGIRIPPGQFYYNQPNAVPKIMAISVFGATTAQTFSIMEG